MATFIQNSFGLKVYAGHYVDYSSAEDLRKALRDSTPKPWLPIGRGSNLLFSSEVFQGTVLHCTDDTMETSFGSNYVRVRVGAGLRWDAFVEMCVEKGWYGAENLSLIPGDVGAAAVQNIGAYGIEAASIISSVEVYDTFEDCERVFFADECEYAYRSSIFKHCDKRYIVLKVIFKLSLEPHFSLNYGNLESALTGEPSLQGVRNAVIAIRRAKLPDPEQIGSAGSFFMNPVVSAEKLAELQSSYPDIPHYPAADGISVKLAAGWLIDRCGCKSMRKGDAAVYEKQALVIVNIGSATASDILALADFIINSVKDRFGLTLRMEVEVV